MKIIETENLTKKYKRYKKQEGLVGSIKGLFHREYEEKIAVDAIHMDVNEGEFVGLIGPNGAGKTTLVKMLTGIIAPTSGKIQVLGFYPNKLEKAFKQQYAVVMGQKSQLFFELTAEDTLKLFKEIYCIPEDEYRRNKNFFVDLFQVQELMNVQVRTLSLGERMKMELIVALLHNPKILFLDEPTIGLDAIASKQIRNFLKDVNESRGTTILLTSHYMEDIKVLCKRSIVMNHGRKIYDGDTDLLFGKYQKCKRMTIYFEHSVEPDVPDDCRVLEKTNDKLVLEIPKQNAEKVLESYIGHYPIQDIGIEEEEIGSVVERIYKGV
ncbi:ABC transporter ATP-binding protein [Marvinbryantia formatexigens]|nr:ATP-binding cassette domain-containing protein [Marvinbryantia formatexigens]UWO24729.1 ATP-binding cassette domain-containing protein [Marvinbryantia formatexigens DSM 14469]SDF20956.1 ABC-2 type transport system ATP-binding protein [Marvinbryantia formatexigens]